MSRVNIGAKPYIMPMPVLIVSSYDDFEEPCAMLAVRGDISNEAEISVTVASQRNTLKGILDRGSFVVSMADVENEAACDFLGLFSGNIFVRSSSISDLYCPLLNQSKTKSDIILSP